MHAYQPTADHPSSPPHARRRDQMLWPVARVQWAWAARHGSRLQLHHHRASARCARLARPAICRPNRKQCWRPLHAPSVLRLARPHRCLVVSECSERRGPQHLHCVQTLPCLRRHHGVLGHRAVVGSAESSKVPPPPPQAPLPAARTRPRRRKWTSTSQR